MTIGGVDVFYYGWRDVDGTAHVRVCHGHAKRLPARRDLFSHSHGYEWGYAGSGPAQLALAILAHALRDDERALRLHQQFKFRAINGLARSSWMLTRDEVLSDVAAIEREYAAREVS